MTATSKLWYSGPERCSGIESERRSPCWADIFVGGNLRSRAVFVVFGDHVFGEVDAYELRREGYQGLRKRN